MCLFSLHGFVATKSHRVQFKLFWSSADGKSPMWPSLVFTTFNLTLWVVSMCFSKYASLCNVLSQILHWIAHLFLSMCSFTFPAVVNAAGHLSHLCVFLSPTHFVTWLLLLLYGILFSQCLHVTSLCDSMCVFSFLPPMQVFSHHNWGHDRHAYFQYALWDVFQKELQSHKWHKKAWW